MSAKENPYASPGATSAPKLSLEESRQLDEELAIARRMTRSPAVGMLVCSIASAFVVFLPIGCGTLLGIQRIPVPWLVRHIVAYWYLYLIPFTLYFLASFFGSLSLLRCQNRLLARIGVVFSLLPFLSPLFPFGMLIGWKGLVILRTPEVQKAFRKAELDERSDRARALARLFGPATVILMIECVAFSTLLLPFGLSPLLWYFIDPQLAERQLQIYATHTGLRLLVMSLSGGFITYAAVQMLRGRRYVVYVLGASAALIPFLSPCIFFGIPFGLWALVILLQKETRAAFAEINQPTNQPAAAPHPVNPVHPVES